MPGKMQQVICTGNACNKQTVDFLHTLGDEVHMVKGDYEEVGCACSPLDISVPSQTILHYPPLRIGVLHGHQIVPAGERRALSYQAESMDVDVLISGSTHQVEAYEEEGRFFLNPGSATGAWITTSPLGAQTKVFTSGANEKTASDDARSPAKNVPPHHALSLDADAAQMGTTPSFACTSSSLTSTGHPGRGSGRLHIPAPSGRNQGGQSGVQEARGSLTHGRIGCDLDRGCTGRRGLHIAREQFVARASRSTIMRVAALRNGLSAPRAVRRRSLVPNVPADGRRGLAIPVNPMTSVDHMLGSVEPAPPKAMTSTADVFSDIMDEPENYELLSHILRPESIHGGSAFNAQIDRLRSNAAGAGRRSTALPDSDHLLQQALDAAHKRWSAGTSTNALHEEGVRALEHYITQAARALQQATEAQRPIHLPALSTMLKERANRQLSSELAYEPSPKPDRAVRRTTAASSEKEAREAADDGVLLLCYVDGLDTGHERIHICSGFAVEGGGALEPGEGAGTGPLVLSCYHTAESACRKNKDTETPAASATFAMTRKGHVYPVRALLSCMHESDLVLFQLAEQPIRMDPSTSTFHPVAQSSLRMLPVSPYPAVVNLPIAVSSFGGWVPRLDNGDAFVPALSSVETARNRWAPARILGYKDAAGGEAHTGTYDELAHMVFSLQPGPDTPPGLRPNALEAHRLHFPLPGSSGGPVVDTSTGSVVGVVRGNRTSQLHGCQGDAVPSERIFEFFALPGFGKHRPKN